MAHDKLVYMANQIGKFFDHKPEDVAVAAIEDHLRKFWDPRMRTRILEQLPGAPLDPRVRRAVEQLKNPA